MRMTGRCVKTTEVVSAGSNYADCYVVVNCLLGGGGCVLECYYVCHLLDHYQLYESPTG